MRLLVGAFGLPYLPANVATIAVCGCSTSPSGNGWYSDRRPPGLRVQLRDQFMQRLTVLTVAAMAALAPVSCRKSPPANVAATVNSRSITYTELEKIYQSQSPQAAEGSSEDQVMSQRLELLNSLINSEIMWQRAEKLGLTAVDADVETEFNKMKAPYTKEEFDKHPASGR
jgi:hypothetical protein